MKLSVFILLLCPLLAIGQQKKIRALQVSDTIAFAAVDRPGELYIVTKSGQLQKFDKDGALLNLLKPKNSVTLFDPRDGSRLFAFVRELRQYWIMNPSFEVNAVFELDSAFAIDPWLICSSGDHNLWVLDASDNSLKKINTKSGNVTVEINAPVKAREHISYMREYQGFLFLLDRSEGILIFNSVGKLIRTLPGKNIPFFNFIGEELYYPATQKLNFFNLFTAESRQSGWARGARFVLLTDERQFIVNNTDILINTAP
jgi:WD40 repeat protein